MWHLDCFWCKIGAMKINLKALSVIAPILVSFLLSVVVVMAYNADYRRNVDSMFIQKREMIDLVADGLDKSAKKHEDYETQREFYSEMLINDIERIDQQPFTLAVAYDKNFKRVTARYYGQSNFGDMSPIDYEEVKKAVSENKRGVVRTSGRDVRTFYYRWCPADHGNQYLLMVAIDADRIVEGGQNYVYPIIIILAITVALNIGMLRRSWK